MQVFETAPDLSSPLTCIVMSAFEMLQLLLAAKTKLCLQLLYFRTSCTIASMKGRVSLKKGQNRVRKHSTWATATAPQRAL